MIYYIYIYMIYYIYLRIRPYRHFQMWQHAFHLHPPERGLHHSQECLPFFRDLSLLWCRGTRPGYDAAVRCRGTMYCKVRR